MPPLTAEQFRLRPWARKPVSAINTLPNIVSVSASSATTAGTGTATITGSNFRAQANGDLPVVMFGDRNAYRDAVLAHDPVGFWQLAFNGIDLGSGGNDGVKSGVDPVVYGKAGPTADGRTASQFVQTNTGCWLDMGNVTDLNLTGAFTLLAWAKTSQATIVPLIASKWDSSHGYFFGLNAGVFRAGCYRADGTQVFDITSPLSYADGAYHRFGVTYDQTSAILYVDGIAVKTVAATLAPNATTGNFNIGRTSDSNNFFNGTIADVVVISGEAMTAAEMLADYTVSRAGAGTGVVVVSSTSITVTIPSAVDVGPVNLNVIEDAGLSVATLPDGFLYYAGTIGSVTPKFTTLAGGLVTIVGTSFSAGSTFTFGGVAGTSPTFIDSSHYAVTAPAHAIGFVDVVMTESGGHTSTLRNGLQYVEAVRVNDIRRNPGINITEASGSAPNEAHFVIGGRSQSPVPGEDVAINDAFDNNRLLFAGTLLDFDATFEGIDQLVWHAHAVDWQFLMNRRRPFGNYMNVSVSDIITDLMARFAPDFSTAFVQTKLAPVSISLDGTRTLSEVFDILAQAIGGGRWYMSYTRVLHFYHPPLADDIVLPTNPTGGVDFTPAVLSTGAALNSTVHFDAAYYAVRVTFVYSNGTESRLGPGSNVYPFSGASKIHIGSIPIGLNPSGSITVIARKIYYLKGRDALASGWTVNDNVTTDIEVTPDLTQPDTTTVTVNVGDPVTIPDGDPGGGSTGGGGGTTSQTPQPGAIQSGCPSVSSISGSGYGFLIAGGIAGTDASGFAHGFRMSGPGTYGIFTFKISATYPDGSETPPSGRSQPVVWGKIEVSGGFNANVFTYADGTVYNSRGLDVWMPDLASAASFFPDINGKSPSQFNIYAGMWKRNVTTNQGGGVSSWIEVRNGLEDPEGYQFIGAVPFFRAVSPTTHDPLDPSPSAPPGTTIPTNVPTPPQDPDYGDKPIIPPGSVEPTLTWPNPDGPYLENFAPPEDVTDASTLVLRIPACAANPTAVEDISQLRNLVKVFGGGTTLVANAPAGAFQVQVADVSIFSVNGGTLMASNGYTLKFFSTAELPTGNFLLLPVALPKLLPEGTNLQYYAEAEDKVSQLKRGAIELDSNGGPTDGIHEYVISDTSLVTAQQVYIRAHAEIQVYSNPIVTVRYSTRDPLTRVGATVHFNLNKPPIQGDFLIQSITIDQIHDQSDTLDPRYNVVASSVRYDLSNYLLTFGLNLGQSSISSGSNQTGLVPAAVDQTSANSDFITVPVGSKTKGKRFLWGQAQNMSGATSPLWAGQAPASMTGGNNTADSDGVWFGSQSAAGSQAQISAPTAFTRYELAPILRTRFRLNTASFPARMLISLNESFAGVNTDTPSLTAQRGIYLRYSQIAGDTGWRVMTVSNAGIFLSPVFLQIQRTTTIFEVTIAVTPLFDADGIATGLFQAVVTVNGSSVTVSDGFKTGLLLGYEMLVQGVTVPSTIAINDFQSLYLESN